MNEEKKLAFFFVFSIILSIFASRVRRIRGGLVSLVNKVKTMRDSMVVKGIDRHYIDVPERPWQVIVRGNVNQTIVSMKKQGTWLVRINNNTGYLNDWFINTSIGIRL
jgi:hypothetical protein